VKNESDYYILDPIVGHIHKSNAKRYYVWPEHKDGHIILKTNNFGFRRDTDTLTDKHDKIRILVTGDSQVDGVINNSESCCSILENLLNKAVHCRHYEVINSGVGYYCPHNYLGVIKKYLYLAPDIFIVTLYGGNDFIETCALMGCQRSNDHEYYAKLKKVRSFNPGGLGQGLNQLYYFKFYPKSLEISLKAVMDDFHSINEICDSHNIILIVLLLPSKIDIEWPTDDLRLNKCKELLNLTDAALQINTKLLDALSVRLDNNKINYLNLYDYLKGKDRKLFWNEDYHLNDYGHQIVAETLFAKYKEIFFRVGKTETK
jgi:lysophospholipase L1-like esterase